MPVYGIPFTVFVISYLSLSIVCIVGFNFIKNKILTHISYVVSSATHDMCVTILSFVKFDMY